MFKHTRSGRTGHATNLHTRLPEKSGWRACHTPSSTDPRIATLSHCDIVSFSSRGCAAREAAYESDKLRSAKEAGAALPQKGQHTQGAQAGGERSAQKTAWPRPASVHHDQGKRRGGHVRTSHPPRSTPHAHACKRIRSEMAACKSIGTCKRMCAAQLGKGSAEGHVRPFGHQHPSSCLPTLVINESSNRAQHVEEGFIDWRDAKISETAAHVAATEALPPPPAGSEDSNTGAPF